MNAKKAKALRQMARRLTQGKQQVVYKEMGANSRMVEDGIAKERMVRITAPITVASDTTRGQYQALKRIIKAEYGINKK